MIKTYAIPATLREAIKFFSDKDFAHGFFVQLRWPDGPKCISCGDGNVAFYPSRRLFQCRVCRRQFTAKIGTIFEDSPIGLEKWLPALWLLVNAKNGISSYELARAIGVTQKTGWFMLGRIRLAAQTQVFRQFAGEIEVDESFIGGLAKFMHKKDRKRRIRGTGGMDKTAVMGILERGKGKRKSAIKAMVLRDRSLENVQDQIHEHVEHGSTLYSDTAWNYGRKRRFRGFFKHYMINHARQYVRGRVHTQGLENFWSLLKRAIKGTYVHVDPFHLFRYVDEQVRRFNQREATDAERFVSLLRDVLGRRLTYHTLTGKDLAPATT